MVWLELRRLATLAGPKPSSRAACLYRSQAASARLIMALITVKWVSLSFPQFGEIGGYPGCDDGVVGGRSDGHRLLDEAVEQEASGL